MVVYSEIFRLGESLPLLRRGQVVRVRLSESVLVIFFEKSETSVSKALLLIAYI